MTGKSTYTEHVTVQKMACIARRRMHLAGCVVQLIIIICHGYKSVFICKDVCVTSNAHSTVGLYVITY